MKKVFTFFVAVLLTATVWAQSPNKMSYQAVIRNSNLELVTNTAIGMQISILQGSASGTAVYVETQNPTTNDNGLASIEIGAGTVQSGDFAAINWEDGPYFIKTETDPDGGTSYTITGTSQLLSVPYALHSKTAETITGEITETDPVFTAWDKSTGISITESQISDLGAYIETETDPVFTAWDKSTGISITESQISDLGAYIETETDPVFTTWDKSTGISITESQISDLGAYIETEIDPRVPVGITPGEIQYWNGTEWAIVPAGNEGDIMTFINNTPTWVKVPTTVENPTTGKIWIDRNLGASQVATSSTDSAAYGDLYQWGRAADGHQIRTSDTTSTQSSSDDPGHGNFIIKSMDWRNPQNDNLWQGVSGINNPCPSGFRLPTEVEWEAERTSWSSNNAAGAFASVLKLPMAGSRNYGNGTFAGVDGEGHYWSSTVDDTKSRHLYFFETFALWISQYRANGFSVRCIKD
ncbi:MAG: FISUMP domain-containing protein [Bacteroidales bacterium]|nr:FISUMP domain-containing protein [Bacteroidales bacterium]